MAFQTRLASSGPTVGTRLMVRDTVAIETLARRATSRISSFPEDDLFFRCAATVALESTMTYLLREKTISRNSLFKASSANSEEAAPSGGHTRFEDAMVHHDLDARGLSARCGPVVTDALLQPKPW